MLSVLPPWLTRNDGWEGVGHGGGAQSTAQRRTGRRGEGAVRGTTASKAWPVRGSGRELKAGCAGAPEAFALRGLQSGAGNSRRPRTRHTRTTSACPCPHAASAAAPARPGGASGGRGGPLCCALGERPPPLTPQPPPSVKSSGTPGWWPCPLRNARNAERGRNCQRADSGPAAHFAHTQRNGGQERAGHRGHGVHRITHGARSPGSGGLCRYPGQPGEQLRGGPASPA